MIPMHLVQANGQCNVKKRVCSMKFVCTDTCTATV